MMSEQLINVTEAQKLLNVSKKKMASLLAEGTLPYVLDPLDKRVKLISIADLEHLMEQRLRKAA